MKIKFILIVAIIFLTAFVVMRVNSVDANPSQILENKSASATTTLTYVAVTATSSHVVDLQSDGGFVPDTATLFYWMNATNTTSVMNIDIQYSNGVTGVDCSATPTKCDWFQLRGTGGDNHATTSTLGYLSVVANYTHTFASSSPELIGNASNAFTTGAITISKIPARYVRAIFTKAVGSANWGVWSSWVYKRQTR